MAQRAGDDFWASLTPDEQDMIMSSFGMTGPTPMDYGFEDDLGAMDPFSFGGNLGLSGMGSPGVQPFVGGYETKGKVDPMSRTEEAGRVNLLQDYGSLSVDNILSGYGGGGSYDVGAFTPTYEWGEPLNLKGRRRAETLARSGGYQGFLADLIFNEELTDAEAEAKLYEVVNAPDEGLSDADRAKRQALIDSMPPSMRDDGINVPSSRSGAGAKARTGREQWDTDIIHENAASIWNGLMDDPEFAHFDEASGQYYGKTPEEAMVKTPQMLAYDKFGIPYPTASYEDPKYLDAMTQSLGGPVGEEADLAAEGYLADQRRLEREVGSARGRAQRSYGATQDLESALGGVKQRPMTEWDAMAEAFRNDQDQTAARDEFRGRYGGARQPTVPRGPATIPGFVKDQGPVGGPRGGRSPIPESNIVNLLKGGAATPPMVTPPGPLAGIDRFGNRVLSDSPTLARSGALTDAFDFGHIFRDEQREAPKMTPLKRGDVEKQKGRATADRSKARQAREAQVAATYRDPRLAGVESMVRAYVLANAGQTPFRDAMASRNANARRMLGG